MRIEELEEEDGDEDETEDIEGGHFNIKQRFLKMMRTTSVEFRNPSSPACQS